MSFEQFVAKRYLISKHKINFITIISFLSVLGITIGVAALIVVLSVFNGFGSLVTSFLMNFDPHLRVEIISPDVKEGGQTILAALDNVEDLKAFSPYVSGKVVAYRKNETSVINLKGIDVEKGEKLYGIRSNTIYGKYDFAGTGDIPGIIIGLRLADRLRVLVGDTLTLISPVGIEKTVTQYSPPKMQQFLLSGIYSSNNNEYDANFIFASIGDVSGLLGYSGRVQGYDIRLTDIDNSADVKEQLSYDLKSEHFSVSTWYDFHQELYSVMQIERWAAYIILTLIIAVATFNILGSLSMSVIEKKRDIGIMAAMGVRQNSILKIFMYEGLLIGLLGTAAGVILGYFICYLQLEYNIYPLDPTQYKINSLPLEIRVSDFFYITGASLLLSFLASLMPAKRAAKVNPLEAIKWE